jgi:Flp pilus assembly protein TadG
MVLLGMRPRFLMSGFCRDTSGNFSIMSALLVVPLMLAVGVAVDFNTAYQRRTAVQSASDAAVLTAASNYSSSSGVNGVATQVDNYLAGNAGGTVKRLSTPTLSSDSSQICIRAGDSVPTTFMNLAGVSSVPISASSCASLPGQVNLEVSLVLDVSSSMIEESRFVPMQTAVKAFINAFANNSTVAAHTKIAIAPFSSRFNIGMAHTSWLKAYNGSPAIPARWSSPKTYYSSSSYSFTQWIDSLTWLAYTSSNYYWTGCVEPRADVEVKDTGAIGSYGLTDVAPSTVPFVPMDDNSGSAKSFCPPPITPLTSNFTYLQSAIAQMTSEGSTRLDAGILAGWYTLSPNWQSAWGASAPAAYSTKVRKAIVFMTDGEMNVKYGPSDTDKLDWLCNKTRTDACNDIATDAFLKTCASIKAKNIDIYAVSYSKEADVSNLQSCSSGSSYYFSADTSTISEVYTAIQKSIVSSTVRLTQ